MVELRGRKRAWNAGGLQRNQLPQGSTGSKKARTEEKKLLLDRRDEKTPQSLQEDDDSPGSRQRCG